MKDPGQHATAYSLVWYLFSKSRDARRLFIMSASVSVLIGALGSYLYSQLLSSTNASVESIESEGGSLLQQLLILYIGQKMIDWSMEFSLQRLQSRAVNMVCEQFERECLVWYQTGTSFESRERIDGPKFYHAVQDVRGSVIKGLALWLVYQVLSVATTFLTALFSFGLVYGWILAATALLMALVVKFFYQPRRAMTVMRETERQRAKEHTRGRLSFLLPQFTFGNVSSQTVLEHSSIIETTRDEFNLEMLSLVRIISLAVIACMGFLFLVDADNLVPALVSLNMLGTAINQLLECMSHLSFAENKFNEFKEMLGKLERECMFGTLELPWSWSLTKAEIPRQSAIVSLDESQLPLLFERGSSVLIRGSSGHGKSTLVKGITGQLAGCEIDYLDSRIFRDSFVLVGQGGKHKLEFEMLTLGDLFETADIRLVQDLCSICLLSEWLEDMVRSNPGQSVLDVQIELSGGERNRLTLAYYLWLSEQKQARVLILDECEQGTDVVSEHSSNTVYELVRRIRQAYVGMTLIVVSHFYDERGHPLVPGAQGIEWNSVITMSNLEGTVQ